MVFLSNYSLMLGSTLSYGDEFECKAIDGLFDISGSAIKCYIMNVQFADPSLNLSPVAYTTIRMKFFRSILAGSVIRFHIPNILNPTVNWATIRVMLKQKTNRRE